jgi:hypothetical protein
MKNKIIYTLLLIVTAAGVLTSCKKSNNKATDDPCNKLNMVQKATVSYTRPCAIAISKSGIVAVVQYNGFLPNGYGTNGTTTIWKSYADFIANKEQLQHFNSIGSESVCFDNNENLYVTETEGTAGIVVYKKSTQNNSIIYNRTTVIQGQVNGGFYNPRGIAFDSQNRLYIANDGKGNIVRINDPLNNGPQQIIGAELNGIKGLAIDGSTLYATLYDQNVVFKATLKANGDFGEITNTMTVQKPVDIAIKDGILAISSPDGLVTLIEADKMVTTNKTYTGCKKEINVGKNVFGMAFNPAGPELSVAALDQNKVITYQPQ